MVRSACFVAVGALMVLSGCSSRLTDVPSDRPPAVVVALTSARCPAETVLLTDDDPDSGAGAIPADFPGRTLLRCEVDYRTIRSRDGVDTYTVRQWRTSLTPQLRAALDLPDREFRPNRGACAAGSWSTTALYALDARSRAVRVLAPTDDPCQQIREEVMALLPSQDTPAEQTLRVSRRAS